MTPSTILFVFLATFAGVSLASWAHTWLTDAIDETRQTKAVPWRAWAALLVAVLGLPALWWASNFAFFA